MTCLECEKRGPWVCASNPLKVRCPITLEYHTLDHECNVVETKGEEMNEAWKEILAGYVKGYDSIEHLFDIGLLGEDEKTSYRAQLLFDMIEDMRSEVEK